MLESSPPAASPSSESELLDASSTSAPFLEGGSSGISSMRGFDIVNGESGRSRNVSNSDVGKLAAKVASISSRQRLS